MVRWFGVISLFPQMFDALLKQGVVGRAHGQGLFECAFFNPRDYADNPRGYIDDRPFGGGAGMVLQPGPLEGAILDARSKAPSEARVVYVSPSGKPFTQKDVPHFLGGSSWIWVAGRYEGVDQRVIDSAVDEVWSIGDYVLSGGELPIMVMMDAILRSVPGVLGDSESLVQESFAEGLLEHPQYTRPAVYEGHEVPLVLQQGDHGAIRRWRLKQSLGLTWQKRPDLIECRVLNAEEQRLLAEFQQEMTQKGALS